MIADANGFFLDLGAGLTARATADSHSPVLDEFYEGYDRAFILPDEREDLHGFRQCLALNATYGHAFGRCHREMVIVVNDGNGMLLGGANFLAVGMPPRTGWPVATVALNYVYVERAARGRGLLRQLLAGVRRLALMATGLPADAPGPTIFIEQNDPLRLTEADFRLDTGHSGTDQVDRLAIWNRMGARIVDFPYVQPALSPGQQPDDRLVYAAIDHPGEAIDPHLLHDHLESFFAISVLKGMTEAPGGTAAAQLALLAKRDTPLALLPIGPALEWLRNGFGKHRGAAPGSLRDLAHMAGVA